LKKQQTAWPNNSALRSPRSQPPRKGNSYVRKRRQAVPLRRVLSAIFFGKLAEKALRPGAHAAPPMPQLRQATARRRIPSLLTGVAATTPRNERLFSEPLFHAAFRGRLPGLLSPTANCCGSPSLWKLRHAVLPCSRALNCSRHPAVSRPRQGGRQTAWRGAEPMTRQGTRQLDSDLR